MKMTPGTRVLMLMENSRYPADPRVRQEAEALVAAGHRVTVICPGSPGQKARETVEGVQLYRYPAPADGNGILGYLLEYGYCMLASLALSLELLVREGFDVVHTANPPDTFVFIAGLYKLLGKRFLYDHHDLAPEMYYAHSGGSGNRLVHRTLLFLERLSCRLADHVIATNQSYKMIEMERDHVPAERITVVRNGPNPDQLKPVGPALQLRRQGKTTIGYVGVMGFQDGVDYLLRALSRLVHDLGRTDAFCVLMGGGDALTDLRSLTERLGLQEHVLFTGWVAREDLPSYLSAMDSCVAPEPSNPYNDHSTMIKIMEYMALGKPIVCFDLPEHRFSAQAAALYVRPNDEMEFARALAQLMDDPVRRQTMGAYGRERVETELAWDYSAVHLLAAYDLLVAHQNGRRVTQP